MQEKNELKKLVLESNSLSDILRKQGKSISGSSMNILKNSLKNYNIDMADKNNHLVIMAGGVGSRFWPMSTQECPKQFIDVLGVGKSLLQLTMDRFKSLAPS